MLPAHSLHVDFETYSALDLPKCGLYRYALHPSTGIWVASYRFGESGPVSRWHPGEEPPWDLIAHIEAGGTVICHHAAFERTLFNIVFRRIVGEWVPLLRIEQQVCTMARAQAAALPGQLEKVAPIVSKFEKDLAGSALMRKVCKPRRIEADGTVVWWNSDPAWPDMLRRLGDYCDDDVRAETGVDVAVPQLTPHERRVWEFDQRMNERGMKMDRFLVQRCIDLVEVSKHEADRRMWKLTDGAVKTVSQTAKLLKWFQDRGIPATSMKKGEHENIVTLTDIIDDMTAKQVMELRRDTNKTSTGKFPKMLECASEHDDRMRGLYNYHAATTSRWGGRLVQPHNFTRVDEDRDLPTVLAVVELLKGREPPQVIYEIIQAIYGEVMPWLAKLLRAMVIADDGKDLIFGDLSNIEGRLNAWFAGAQWKLDAFRAYDTIIGHDAKGKEIRAGHDLYNIAYSRSFGKPVEDVAKADRQIGKVQELALGYQGSVGAHVSMVNTYLMSIPDLARAVKAVTSSQQWDRTADGYDKRHSFNLPEDWWTACKIIVDNWRVANAEITQSWWNYQDAAIEAVLNPERMVFVQDGKARYMHTRGVLLCALPDGKVLNYWNPRVVESGGTEIEVLDEEGNVVDVVFERRKRQVVYQGVHKKTKKWSQLSLYGGEQCNHIVQGSARQILFGAMERVEAAGYPVIGTVHDENISEVDEGFGDEKEYARLMAVVPPEFTGLPLAAKAGRDKRYTK